MTCPNCTEEIYREYPQQVPVIFMSTVDGGTPLSTGAVTSSLVGYVNEMGKLGQDSTGIGSGPVDNPNPYSPRLRPVSDFQKMFRQTQVYLTNIEFSAFDCLNTNDSSGYQVAATNTAILSFTPGSEKPYAQSTYLNGLVPNWQPNWFRPIVRINGKDIVEVGNTHFLSGTNNTEHHEGDGSIGLRHDTCFDVYQAFKEIKDIDIRAQVVQYIGQSTDSRKYKRYGVHCVMNFRRKA